MENKIIENFQTSIHLPIQKNYITEIQKES